MWDLPGDDGTEVVAEKLGVAALVGVGTSWLEIGATVAAAQLDVEVFEGPPWASEVDMLFHGLIEHIQLRGTGLGKIQVKGTGNSMSSSRTHLVCALRLGTASEPGHIVGDTAASEDSLWRRER